MHGDPGHATSVIFGLSPIWVATSLFVITYLVIMSDRLNRAIVALLGAGTLILVGVLNQHEAMAAVDFNTLGLLLGMMLIVNITRRSGLFQYVAIWSAKKVDAKPWGILLMMSIVTAVFSAFLDNVTTVLLTVPVTLLITEELKVKAYPYLFAQIFASNIGGTATLIGDPPNIMIGSATGLTFNDFALALTPVIVVVFVATMIPLYFIWGRHLSATDENRRRVMAFNEREAITDPRLLKQSLTVIALVIVGFMLQREIKIEPATIAIFGAATLMLLDNLGKDAETQSKNVHGALSEAEWITLMFFLGLFVLVFGIQPLAAVSSDLVASMVMKPIGLYGGKEVAIGREMGSGDWEKVMQTALRDRFVAQEYIPIPEISLPVFSETGLTFSPKKVNMNFFAFNGLYAGGMARVSDSSIINISAGGGLIPILLAKPRTNS